MDEQHILGNMMADLIQAKTNLTVETKFNLGTASILQQAMENHEIDMYPEYTGTAYLNILKDDQHLFLACYAAPIVDDSMLKNTYKSKKTLANLAGLINNKTMQQHNDKVDVLKLSPAKVTHDF